MTTTWLSFCFYKANIRLMNTSTIVWFSRSLVLVETIPKENRDSRWSNRAQIHLSICSINPLMNVRERDRASVHARFNLLEIVVFFFLFIQLINRIALVSSSDSILYFYFGSRNMTEVSLIVRFWSRTKTIKRQNKKKLISFVHTTSLTMLSYVISLKAQFT